MLIIIQFFYLNAFCTVIEVSSFYETQQSMCFPPVI
jgi:hypothetical protein